MSRVVTIGGETIEVEPVCPAVLDGNSAPQAIVEWDYWIRNAINETFAQFGDSVSVYAKKENLNKFGENLVVGTSKATLMDLPAGVLNETYVSTNTIAYFSSSNAGDNQTVKVEGHTVDGNGDFTFVVQTITLAGQTKTALGTPVARISRAYNTDATEYAGTVYFYEDDTVIVGVPATGSKVHLIMHPDEQQTTKASTTFSSSDYAFLTKLYASINDKTAAAAVIRLEVRQKGGVFRTAFKLGISSTGSNLDIDFRPFVIIPANADVRITAEADGANTAVAGGFECILASVV